MLAGKRLEEGALRQAAETALAGAKPYEGNKFKVELAKRAIVRAVLTAGGTA
jgi:xanthine dehydrogenase YagS FAD-binding subunit